MIGVDPLAGLAMLCSGLIVCGGQILPRGGLVGCDPHSETDSDIDAGGLASVPFDAVAVTLCAMLASRINELGRRSGPYPALPGRVR